VRDNDDDNDDDDDDDDGILIRVNCERPSHPIRI
jgi:hypothetical protein